MFSWQAKAMLKKADQTLPKWQRHEAITLLDGRSVCVRPIQAADALPIAGTFHLLHEDEIRKRFLHPVKALSDDYLLRLTQPNPETDFVVAAAEPFEPGAALIGAVARLSVDDNGGRAEFGILVSHFVSGQGLGKILMRRLIEWCKHNHVRHLWGDVLDDNQAMLKLAESLGFVRESRHTTPGITRIVLTI
jgi:RimJ/RimL family protein N-acetyltransferase